MPPSPASDRRYCPNCHYPLAGFGEFCSQCGQKYTTGKVTFRELVEDFFEAVLNFDSKIFRTLRDLFIPGKLTDEYSQGRQQRYISPVRLFLTLAVLLLAAVGFTAGDEINEKLLDLRRQEEQSIHQAFFLEKLDTVKREILRQSRFTQSARLPEALDSVSARFKDTRRDSTGFLLLDLDSSAWYQLNVSTDFKIPSTEMEALSPQEILQKYQINGWINNLAVRQQLKLKRNVGSFVQYLIGKTVWMVLLMMPALALILKLLYIRRGRYYVEHLIFSFHYHSFAFLILSLGLAASYYKIDLFGWISLAITVYLLLAMRRVYGQGWGKTLIKFFLLNLFYINVLAFFLLITVAMGVLFF